MVDQKLQELAGKGATNCGRIKSVDQANTKTASNCAVEAAQAKKPFFVAYDMPGLTVGIAGTHDGKLYAVQAQSAAPVEGQTSTTSTSSTPGQVTVNPCPSELRVASSGRVTCYAAGSFGTGSGMNPHGGGMMMPPGGTMNPHGGDMMTPPPGTPNPHGTAGSMPSAHGSAIKNEQPARKNASKQ